MRVLICGGRNYADDTAVDTVLRGLWLSEDDCIIHGGASGADSLADSWARERSIDRLVYRANWEKYSWSAGPIRNQRMLDEGHPDLVVAFPGGRGTADMVRRAKAAGIKVMQVLNHALIEVK